jgi:3-methyladenine DNA glycosylase/8-oxoguanine DNA glycosylase
MDITQKNYKFREGYDERKKKRDKISKKVSEMGVLPHLRNEETKKRKKRKKRTLSKCNNACHTMSKYG